MSVLLHRTAEFLDGSTPFSALQAASFALSVSLEPWATPSASASNQQTVQPLWIGCSHRTALLPERNPGGGDVESLWRGHPEVAALAKEGRAFEALLEMEDIVAQSHDKDTYFLLVHLYNIVGLEYVRQGMADSAIELFSKAENVVNTKRHAHLWWIRPCSLATHINFATVLRRRNQLHAALEHMQAATKIVQQGGQRSPLPPYAVDVSVYINTAALLVQLGRLSEAADAAQQALALSGANVTQNITSNSNGGGGGGENNSNEGGENAARAVTAQRLEQAAALHNLGLVRNSSRRDVSTNQLACDVGQAIVHAPFADALNAVLRAGLDHAKRDRSNSNNGPSSPFGNNNNNNNNSNLNGSMEDENSPLDARSPLLHRRKWLLEKAQSSGTLAAATAALAAQNAAAAAASGGSSSGNLTPRSAELETLMMQGLGFSEMGGSANTSRTSTPPRHVSTPRSSSGKRSAPSSKSAPSSASPPEVAQQEDSGSSFHKGDDEQTDEENANSERRGSASYSDGEHTHLAAPHPQRRKGNPSSSSSLKSKPPSAPSPPFIPSPAPAASLSLGGGLLAPGALAAAIAAERERGKSRSAAAGGASATNTSHASTTDHLNQSPEKLLSHAFANLNDTRASGINNNPSPVLPLVAVEQFPPTRWANHHHNRNVGATVRADKERNSNNAPPAPLPSKIASPRWTPPTQQRQQQQQQQQQQHGAAIISPPSLIPTNTAAAALRQQQHHLQQQLRNQIAHQQRQQQQQQPSTEQQQQQRDTFSMSPERSRSAPSMRPFASSSTPPPRRNRESNEFSPPSTYPYADFAAVDDYPSHQGHSHHPHHHHHHHSNINHHHPYSHDNGFSGPVRRMSADESSMPGYLVPTFAHRAQSRSKHSRSSFSPERSDSRHDAGKEMLAAASERSQRARRALAEAALTNKIADDLEEEAARRRRAAKRAESRHVVAIDQAAKQREEEARSALEAARAREAAARKAAEDAALREAAAKRKVPQKKEKKDDKTEEEDGAASKSAAHTEVELAMKVLQRASSARRGTKKSEGKGSAAAGVSDSGVQTGSVDADNQTEDAEKKVKRRGLDAATYATQAKQREKVETNTKPSTSAPRQVPRQLDNHRHKRGGAAGTASVSEPIKSNKDGQQQTEEEVIEGEEGGKAADDEMEQFLADEVWAQKTGKEYRNNEEEDDEEESGDEGNESEDKQLSSGRAASAEDSTEDELAQIIKNENTENSNNRKEEVVLVHVEPMETNDASELMSMTDLSTDNIVPITAVTTTPPRHTPTVFVDDVTEVPSSVLKVITVASLREETELDRRERESEMSILEQQIAALHHRLTESVGQLQFALEQKTVSQNNFVEMQRQHSNLMHRLEKELSNLDRDVDEQQELEKTLRQRISSQLQNMTEGERLREMERLADERQQLLREKGSMEALMADVANRIASLEASLVEKDELVSRLFKEKTDLEREHRLERERIENERRDERRTMELEMLRERDRLMQEMKEERERLERMHAGTMLPLAQFRAQTAQHIKGVGDEIMSLRMQLASPTLAQDGNGNDNSEAARGCRSEEREALVTATAELAALAERMNEMLSLLGCDVEEAGEEERVAGVGAKDRMEKMLQTLMTKAGQGMDAARHVSQNSNALSKKIHNLERERKEREEEWGRERTILVGHVDAVQQQIQQLETDNIHLTKEIERLESLLATAQQQWEQERAQREGEVERRVQERLEEERDAIADRALIAKLQEDERGDLNQQLSILRRALQSYEEREEDLKTQIALLRNMQPPTQTNEGDSFDSALTSQAAALLDEEREKLARLADKLAAEGSIWFHQLRDATALVHEAHAYSLGATPRDGEGGTIKAESEDNSEELRRVSENESVAKCLSKLSAIQEEMDRSPSPHAVANALPIAIVEVVHCAQLAEKHRKRAERLESQLASVLGEEKDERQKEQERRRCVMLEEAMHKMVTAAAETWERISESGENAADVAKHTEQLVVNLSEIWLASSRST